MQDGKQVQTMESREAVVDYREYKIHKLLLRSKGKILSGRYIQVSVTDEIQTATWALTVHETRTTT